MSTTDDTYEAENHRLAKQAALIAAGMSWGGISSISNRDKAILETADKFLAWLETPTIERAT